ncbi:L10-interacting MYB domain-containing protein-like isoform X2 [Prosopis cineraria]|uniref:L10-interacting MYB domain-containing protein-like isoform X2 n=1 Tax=Prosopis cineraria TaxID=364024 RepID=UPI0024104F56|nr:L10-interacting MYB domain-containing protein-like isoform X2 [Prosopis cineraria]
MKTNVDSKMWTDPIVKALIDILVEEVQKGNMPNGVFHSRTWTSMTARLNSVTSRSFNVKQLKQKVNRLRSMHREFTLLLKHTGFGWSAETNTVTASEEVWQNYLQAQEKAA